MENRFKPLLPYLSIASPLSRFSDLTQVAEGQYGPVFAARASEGDGISGSSMSTNGTSRLNTLVAVKLIHVNKEDSPKVHALAQEVSIMSKVRHEHVLTTAGLFVQDNTLWVEMELMERSLADMLPLVGEGLIFQEAEVARFASDVLSALSYLETLNIAHRDVRSDNLLISRSGIVKLADFSHATLTKPGELCNTIVPVPPYWMAPEMRSDRPYNAHLADVWSVGATIWEVIEGTPPFFNVEDPRQLGDRWPALKRSSELSPSLHQFLRLCSEADDWRPRAHELLETSFVRGACARNDIVTLLAEVRLMEDGFNGQC
ncbi:kinase-like domain-containing protein [Cantharellus anzutake]|uniref:kinase-like domain-containing protein n=1 Tax=Cantharellus anzutake TaxID=1750568 RepID=UPI00190810CA|nr:kinase-like domain-containing protein [Cantharellus anzutake]KAF8335870.1 kinase-like domain-containing protein [Cantharellus anzutake]